MNIDNTTIISLCCIARSDNNKRWRWGKNVTTPTQQSNVHVVIRRTHTTPRNDQLRKHAKVEYGKYAKGGMYVAKGKYIEYAKNSMYIAKGKYIEYAKDSVYVAEGEYGEYNKEDASFKEGHNKPLTK